MPSIVPYDPTRPPRGKGECPSCGSPRLMREESAYANDGSIRVWQFRCWDCRKGCLGALVMLPKDSTSIGALDEQLRLRHRLNAAKLRGHKRSVIARSRYISSDTLDIKVKVLKGKRRDNS